VKFAFTRMVGRVGTDRSSVRFLKFRESVGWIIYSLGQSLVSSSSTDRSNTSSRDRIVTTIYPESVPAHTPPQAQHPKRSLHRCYIRFHVLHISIYPLVRAHVIILQSERPTTVSSPLLHLPPCSRSHSMIFLLHLHLPTFVS
jgi:hypothetical protein